MELQTMTIVPFRRSAILVVAGAAAMSLSGCLGALSGNVPDSLLTITAAAEPPPADTVRRGTIGSALIVIAPTVPQVLRTTRIPVQSGATNVAYVKDAVWVEPPSRLFQRLLTETIAANGNRLVLNESETLTGPGETLSGELTQFGVNADALQVVVEYTAIRTRDGITIEQQHFEQREGISGVEPAPVAAALNRAANGVAQNVADWINPRGGPAAQ
jgi:cholesterol transport system auxiliary component